MDFSAIIYAAMGGGIGGLLGTLLAGKVKNVTLKSVVQIVPIVLALPLMSSLYKNMYLPRLFPIDDRELLETMPAFAAMKDNDPEVYKNMLSTMDPLIRKNDLTAEGLTPLRQQLYAYIFKKAAVAPTSLLKLQNEISAQQFEELKVIDPTVCTAQAHGRPFRNLDGLLSDEITAKEQEYMAGIIANKENHSLGDKAVGEKVYNQIIAEQVLELGITDGDPKPEDKASNEKMCQLLANLTVKVNELEDEKIRAVAAFISSANQN
jgi:hypothetical protein